MDVFDTKNLALLRLLEVDRPSPPASQHSVVQWFMCMFLLVNDMLQNKYASPRLLGAEAGIVNK